MYIIYDVSTSSLKKCQLKIRGLKTNQSYTIHEHRDHFIQ